jgi:hypothetical protein
VKVRGRGREGVTKRADLNHLKKKLPKA